MSKSVMERLIAIGDIHGECFHLKKVMSQIHPSRGDKFVFLGDYIDRGPTSKQVIDHLLDLKEQFPDTVFLKGNHEDMLLRGLDGDESWLEASFLNGLGKTLESYGYTPEEYYQDDLKLPANHLDFLRNLKDYWLWTNDKGEKFLFVHAGVDPSKPLIEQSEEDLLWIRRPFLYYTKDPGIFVVHGHTPTTYDLSPPEWRVNIDTGCGKGGYLTAIDILSRNRWTSE